MGGIVDENVDSAEFANRLINQRSAMRCGLDVARHQHSLAARLLHPTLRFAGVGLFVEIRDQDVGTFPRIGNCHSATDAAVGSRDDRLLAGQLGRAAVASLAMVGYWTHRASRTGHRLMLLGKWRLRSFIHDTLRQYPRIERSNLPCTLLFPRG